MLQIIAQAASGYGHQYSLKLRSNELHLAHLDLTRARLATRRLAIYTGNNAIEY